MCLPLGGKPPKDRSAEIAAQQERERQARIRTARGEVDEAFTPFNDDYYDKYQTAYTDYYRPQLEEQYGDTRRRLIAQLSNTGQLTGSEGAKMLGRLSTEYNRKGTQMTDQAIAAANDLRARVEGERSNLYNLATSAQDPASVGAQAATMASTLAAPPTFSPLQNAFADFISAAAIPIYNERRGYTGTGTGLFRPAPSAPTGSGSARYVT